MYRMPAEWEPHAATWIAWPHNASDWFDKFSAIDWVYCEIVEALAKSEPVEIICHDIKVRNRAADCLSKSPIDPGMYRLHIQANDRSWLRDSMPTCVHDKDGKPVWMHWIFNAWAKYDNFRLDQEIPNFVGEITKIPVTEPVTEDGKRIVLEGGGFEVDGAGNLLVMEEWLLSDLQVRNPGVTQEEYERIFSKYLGARKTIWLGSGIFGDDTHGHIDDVARFVAPETVVIISEKNTQDVNYESSQENIQRLKSAKSASGNQLTVIELPMPAEVVFLNDRMPASYANFYIANSVVLVPTFNDPNDRVALQILADAFPDRSVVGIHSKDLVFGRGALHCLTQQQVSGGIAVT